MRGEAGVGKGESVCIMVLLIALLFIASFKGSFYGCCLFSPKKL